VRGPETLPVDGSDALEDGSKLGADRVRAEIFCPERDLDLSRRTERCDGLPGSVIDGV
jgi:hypothetical protein